MWIFNGDCRVVGTDLAPDVLICDPPYAERVHARATSCSPVRGVRHRDLGFTHLDTSLQDYICKLATRTRRWVLIYTDIESVGDWKRALEAHDLDYVRAVPWVRWSMPQLSGDRPPQGCEMLICAHPKGRKRWGGPGNLTGLSHKCLRGESKHKTEKPLDQLLDLVMWFTEPGEVIVDPVCGSGTTGLAALLLQRRFFGIEVDETWAKFGNTRIDQGMRGEFNTRDSERLERWLVRQGITDTKVDLVAT